MAVRTPPLASTAREPAKDNDRFGLLQSAGEDRRALGADLDQRALGYGREVGREGFALALELQFGLQRAVQLTAELGVPTVTPATETVISCPAT